MGREVNLGFSENYFLPGKRAEFVKHVFDGQAVSFGGFNKKNEVVRKEKVREGWAIF